MVLRVVCTYIYIIHVHIYIYTYICMYICIHIICIACTDYQYKYLSWPPPKKEKNTKHRLYISEKVHIMVSMIGRFTWTRGCLFSTSLSPGSSADLRGRGLGGGSSLVGVGRSTEIAMILLAQSDLSPCFHCHRSLLSVKYRLIMPTP